MGVSYNSLSVVGGLISRGGRGGTLSPSFRNRKGASVLRIADERGKRKRRKESWKEADAGGRKPGSETEEFLKCQELQVSQDSVSGLQGVEVSGSVARVSKPSVSEVSKSRNSCC